MTENEKRGAVILSAFITIFLIIILLCVFDKPADERSTLHEIINVIFALIAVLTFISLLLDIILDDNEKFKPLYYLYKDRNSNKVKNLKTLEPIIVNPKLVEEIHNSFYSESDKLLIELQNNILSLESNNENKNLIDKSERLKKLGFYSSKEVEDGKNEINQIKVKRLTIDENKKLIHIINYFNNKYPAYKFIAEYSVKRLCNKYNLFYGNVENYTGVIPYEILENMENFKIFPEDTCYESRSFYRDNIYPDGRHVVVGEESHETSYYGKESYDKAIKWYYTGGDYYGKRNFRESNLEIVAPLRNFLIKNPPLNDFILKDNTEIKDPIVLKPVIYDNKKYYLIIIS